MEHYDISLAVMVIKLCWDIDDAIYLKVNAQARQKGSATHANLVADVAIQWAAQIGPDSGETGWVGSVI